jgi:hypothetical protein
VIAYVQGIIFESLLAADPWESLQRAIAAAETLTEEDRAALARVERDGFVLTSLLVKKLRFERAIRGDPELYEEFERDPEKFTACFRRYLARVRPLAFFPEEEARAFREFLVSEPRTR